MDLTPRNHCWWPIFSCCRPPTALASSEVAKQDHDELYHNEYLFLTAPSLKIRTARGKAIEGVDEVANLDTPTTACTDRSADVSFTSEEDNFIGVIALASPESMTSTSRRKVVTFQEFDTVEVIVSSTPQDPTSVMEHDNESDEEADDDDVSDPDEANYWYSALSTSFDGNQSDLNSDEIPEISESTSVTSQTTIVNRNDSNSLTNDQAEIKFYQLMVLMMLRHLFGSWLPGEFDPWHNIFKAQLLRAQRSGVGGKKRKGFRTMMKRELHFVDKKFEVVPQLQREDDIVD